TANPSSTWESALKYSPFRLPAPAAAPLPLSTCLLTVTKLARMTMNPFAQRMATLTATRASWASRLANTRPRVLQRMLMVHASNWKPRAHRLGYDEESRNANMTLLR
ncbi:hypothetical protein L914_12546, partial [Phytophthora nicotianae]